MLPASFSAPADAVVAYKIYGTSDGVGVETESGEPDGYKIPLLIDAGVNLWNAPIVQDGIAINGDIVSSTISVHSIITDLIAGEKYTVEIDDDKVIKVVFAYNGGTIGTKIGMIASFPGVSRLTFTLPSGANCVGVSLGYYSGDNITPSNVILAKLTNAANYDLFIGDTKLGAEEYVDFSTHKIYKLQEGELTPTDPPIPLPPITTYDGENTIFSTETLGNVEFTGEWTAIMGSTEDESIDIGFTVDADTYRAFVAVDDGPSIRVFDTITMPSSAGSFTLQVGSWGREQYTGTVYNALS